MSAWIVSKKHIDYIVTAAIKAELVAASEADATGRMLWMENVKSVAYRYPGDRSGQRPGPVNFRDSHARNYVWEETEILTPGALAKTIGCLSYQSCEHPGWERSAAKKLLDRLEPTEGSYSQAEYEAAPWGWEKRGQVIERPDMVFGGGKIEVQPTVIVTRE